MSKIKSQVLVCALPSKVYLTDKPRWHCTCGFNLRHSLRLNLYLMKGIKKLVKVTEENLQNGWMGHFWPKINTFHGILFPNFIWPSGTLNFYLRQIEAKFVKVETIKFVKVLFQVKFNFSIKNIFFRVVSWHQKYIDP